jgi:hypothetical protein
MKYWILFLLIITSISCKEQSKTENDKERGRREGPDEETTPTDFVNMESFSSEAYGIGLDYPEDYEIFQGELAPNSPVVNVYPSSSGATPPLGIHEEAHLTYITLLPNGYGVDGPAGKRVSLKDWEGGLPINFSVDEGNSIVYLLENNEAWGFLLKFHETPESWNRSGNIFIRLGVENFRAVCQAKEQGNEIPMQECDPLAGDVFKYHGELKWEEKQAVYNILKSLYFYSNDRKDEFLQDLIKVEEPRDNAKVSSPLVIKGTAKGYWFFEAEAPVEVVDTEYNHLGRGSITATEEWMTEDFVPFEGELEYEKPATGEGYLILRRANASGKPEHDRALHIPLSFK